MVELENTELESELKLESTFFLILSRFSVTLQLCFAGFFLCGQLYHPAGFVTT